MRSRRAAIGLGLVITSSGACGEAPTEPNAAATPSAALPATAAPPSTATELATVGNGGCRDWSTLDLTRLEPLTEGSHAPLLDQVWRRVLNKHFDPTLGCRPWDRLREQYAREIAQATTDAQAYATINAMLQELGQSHLVLIPPVATEEHVGPARPDLTVRWIEDQLVVVRSAAAGPSGSVRPGAILHAIDQRPVESIIDRVRARAEPREFASKIAGAVDAPLSCERAGQTHTLTVTNPGDEARTHPVVSCQIPAGDRVTLGNLRNVLTRVESDMLDDAVGRLAFNVWMLPMLPEIQAALGRMRGEGMRALILDLRGNRGGVGAMAVPVARLLLSAPASLGTLRYRDFENEFAVRPESGGDPFTGPVTVLIDEGTASTSEIFIASLREHGRITVIGGGPSAGAALPSVIETMPGGALLQTVVADYQSPGGTVIEGRGIVPDVLVAETRTSFEGGRDPVLEAAHTRMRDRLRSGADPSDDRDRGRGSAGASSSG